MIPSEHVLQYARGRIATPREKNHMKATSWTGILRPMTPRRGQQKACNDFSEPQHLGVEY